MDGWRRGEGRGPVVERVYERRAPKVAPRVPSARRAERGSRVFPGVDLARYRSVAAFTRHAGRESTDVGDNETGASEKGTVGCGLSRRARTTVWAVRGAESRERGRRVRAPERSWNEMKTGRGTSPHSPNRVEHRGDYGVRTSAGVRQARMRVVRACCGTQPSRHATGMHGRRVEKLRTKRARQLR